MDSPLNGKGETVFSDEALETLKELYYNEKWGSPLQLFMPDGTVIGRVKGLEGNAALRKYFEENVLGTGEYVNYLDSETLAPYYEDGTLDPAERENYENSLYPKWLSATYGKTRLEKAGDWLMTKEGRHAALDGIGIFLDPADLVNAVLYLSEGELGGCRPVRRQHDPNTGRFIWERRERDKIPAESSGPDKVEPEQESCEGSGKHRHLY